MEFSNREYFISRIVSNYTILNIDGQKIKLYSPNEEIMYEANEFVRQLDTSGFLMDDDMYDILIERNLWSLEEENNLGEVLPKNLEKLKVELYNALLQSKKRILIKKYIKVTKEEYTRLYNKRHFYDYNTLEGYLIYIKNQFVLEKCIKNLEWFNLDIHKVLLKYYENLLSPDIIRELARTTPWSAYWPILKKNGKIFKNDFITLDQQQLAQWSIVYDNARESTECPPDIVFEDDDMFDGWMVVQNQKYQNQKNKHIVESKVKINADDIFVMADTIEDAKMIESMNTPQAKSIQKSRLKQVEKHGIVKESELTDVKMKRIMESNRAYINRVKGK